MGWRRRSSCTPPAARHPLHAIRCARRYGAVYIRPHNDSENAPILAINRKLGYQPQPGLYQYLHELRAAEDETEG